MLMWMVSLQGTLESTTKCSVALHCKFECTCEKWLSAGLFECLELAQNQTKIDIAILENQIRFQSLSLVKFA